MSSTTEMTAEMWSAWRTFLAAQARLTIEIDRRLRRDHGLTQAEYGSLAALFESDGGRLRAGEIARRLGWEKGRTSHLLSRLERRDLVTRNVDPADGRATDVALTVQGRRILLAAVRNHSRDVLELFVRPVGPDLTPLTAAMDRVLGNLDDQSR